MPYFLSSHHKASRGTESYAFLMSVNRRYILVRSSMAFSKTAELSNPSLTLSHFSSPLIPLSQLLVTLLQTSSQSSPEPYPPSMLLQQSSPHSDPEFLDWKVDLQLSSQQLVVSPTVSRPQYTHIATHLSLPLLLEIFCKVFQDLARISNNNLQESCKKILARFLLGFCKILERSYKNCVSIPCKNCLIFKDLTRTISQEYDKNT